MNKAIIYTIVISLVVVAIGGWMVFCGTNMGVHLDLFSAPNKPRLYRKYMLLYIGGLIILLGLTLIPMIGYCVQMSMEKNEARREQIDANGLDPQNYAANTSNDNANENYRVAVTNHLLQVPMYLIFEFFLPLLIFIRNN